MIEKEIHMIIIGYQVYCRENFMFFRLRTLFLKLFDCRECKSIYLREENREKKKRKEMLWSMREVKK